VSTMIAQTSTAPTSTSPRPSAVEVLIHSAWRRRLLMLSIEQLGFALTVILPGAVVLLLLGTQILNWYWLMLLGLATIVIGVFRVKRRIVSPYAVAQIIDERLHLQDSLSTAWFLLTGSAKCDPDFASFQISKAEEIARGVQPDGLFSFSGQRVWTAAGVMGCVVIGLFAVRYLVTDSLSLRPSLLPLRFTALGERVAELLLPTRTNKRTAEPVERQNAQADAPDQSAKQSEDGKNPGGSAGQQEDSIAWSKAEGGRDAGGEAESRAGTRPEHSSSGLMDKMKDALSGLMTKFEGSPAVARDARQRAAQESRDGLTEDKRSGQTGQTKDGTGQSPDSRQKADAGSGAQEQAQTVEKSSRAGADSDQGPQGKNSNSQSGAGRQDGDKTLTDAEQLKAMGRIAEIIGKRSASVSGEMTVEKSSSQQLQTQYSHQVGRHQDLGGEINRDEIPPEYREYVRAYMNEVHKQAESANGVSTK
jgi:hypothetical protein